MQSIYELGAYLNRQALWTNNIIRKGYTSRLGILEETITDMQLLSMADQFGENVLTKKFSRREEGSMSGADWLWIIGEPGSWLPLLIQAKIVNPQTGNCQHLDYKNGNQRTQLLTYARQHRLVPLYCIYGNIPTDLELPDRFDKSITQREFWACSFITPRSVRLLSMRRLKCQRELIKYAIPWSLPFLDATDSSSINGKLLADSLEKSKYTYKDASTEKAEQLLKGRSDLTMRRKICWENLDAIQTVREKIPKNISQLFSIGFPDAASVPFSSASIISSTPIKEIMELK
ncbi:MAG: hypothetical protein RR063_10995 [Anaerovoracaceae bacterium]